MKFYKELKNVEMYEVMTHDYNPTFIINKVKNNVELGAKGLEIGMGPGIDLLLLNNDYVMEGSDYSDIFIERFAIKNLSISVFKYDVLTMKLAKKYDFIYANKVFQHFTVNQLKSVLIKEYEHLNPGGKIVFTLWRGDLESSEVMLEDLRFTYYQKVDIEQLVTGLGRYKIEELSLYEEENPEDSIYIVLQKYRQKV